MGLYEVVSSGRGSPGLPWVREAKKYQLYERSGLWYVSFSAGGRQVRLSTGCRSFDEAKALVEAHRGLRMDSPAVKVNNKHILRMLERCRYRTRNKAIPFDLSAASLREAVERCRGYCEVTGHALEDSGPFRPSIDRISPELGYVAGNIRIVCLIANTAMLHYGEAALGELAISYCRNHGLMGAAA